MIKFFLLVAITLLVFSCDSQPNGMRDPVPVVVDVPQNINDHAWKEDTSIYLLHLSKNNIIFNHALKQIEMHRWSQLDSLLKKIATAMQEKNVILQADSVAYKRVDSLIKILKENKITQFSLVTDLEND